MILTSLFSLWKSQQQEPAYEMSNFSHLCCHGFFTVRLHLFSFKLLGVLNFNLFMVYILLS